MAKMKANEIVNRHHLVYTGDAGHKNKEWIERISKTEHFILHRVTRHTVNVSRGFLRALKLYCLRYDREAVEL